VEFDMSEILRISKKKRDLGEDALTDEELYMHAGFNALAKRLILGRTEQQRADRARGLEILKSLPTEQQEEYHDWTPEQLQAVWPLLQDQTEDESTPDA
jgi:hypothetical protein